MKNAFGRREFLKKSLAGLGVAMNGTARASLNSSENGLSAIVFAPGSFRVKPVEKKYNSGVDNEGNEMCSHGGKAPSEYETEQTIHPVKFHADLARVVDCCNGLKKAGMKAENIWVLYKDGQISERELEIVGGANLSWKRMNLGRATLGNLEDACGEVGSKSEEAIVFVQAEVYGDQGTCLWMPYGNPDCNDSVEGYELLSSREVSASIRKLPQEKLCVLDMDLAQLFLDHMRNVEGTYVIASKGLRFSWFEQAFSLSSEIANAIGEKGVGQLDSAVDVGRKRFEDKWRQRQEFINGEYLDSMKSEDREWTEGYYKRSNFQTEVFKR